MILTCALMAFLWKNNILGYGYLQHLEGAVTALIDDAVELSLEVGNILE